MKIKDNIAFFLWHRKYTILLSAIILYLLSFWVSFYDSSSVFDNIRRTLLLIAAINASHELHGKKTYVYWLLVICSIWISELSINLTASHTILIVLFLSWVTLKFLRRLLTDKKIDRDYLSWAIAWYMLLWIIWWYLWVMMHTLIPHSFNTSSFLTQYPISDQITFIYWSFSTLTTLGYGDIIPTMPITISLSIILVVIWQVYLTILLWIILSKFLAIKK